ncbi:MULTISPECIES: hypothetical protein [unclassified Oceanispirochaeta]|uniref:hypothetical protein n=1 Tax=unclassified Oceanispirochaeta TaxID=2635722 RepID=UPI000E09CF28|nr:MULTISPECIES: hypothetical protein [unclassified Oceanispirochaeta]MBF9016518.1 hypothetical protein [Oceanispirochaeta sp. M2]NPD72980.1 hypothetical protein [Oceanispirochaeta sp. M1]RDG31324.1 hypothetical protein DV872_12800 [Oceanispirochaeta sp. M1]
MSKELLIAGVSFGLFVVCPRMAGMMHIINKHTNVSMLITVLLGIGVSIPILFLMVFVFSKFGVWGALSICVLTDLGAALFMKEISMKAGFETFIIAVFVIIGVKTAPLLSKLIIK